MNEIFPGIGRESMTHPPNHFWIIGAAEGGTVPDSHTLCVPVAGASTPFSWAQRLIESLSETDDAQVLARLRHHNRTIALIRSATPDASDQHALVAPTLAAITRRISRETAQIASVIDDAARCVVKCLRLRRVSHLVLDNVESIDSSSLRLLVRVAAFAAASPLRITCHFSLDPLVPIAIDCNDSRFSRARHKLFVAAAARLNPVICRRPTSVQSASSSRERDTPDFNSLEQGRTQVATALTFQAYDHAYHLCDRLTLHATTDDERADALRFRALVDVNMDEIDDAIAALTQALEFATCRTLKAHLRYLYGLVMAKRKYNLAAASASFEAGLTDLDASSQETAEDQIERAWLLNGLAFVHTLTAKSESRSGGDEALVAALHHELAALRQIQQVKTPNADYLRFNLLANTAFLFELMGRYEDALGFWERAFQPLFDGRENSEASELSLYHFNYRLGILHHRAGAPERAKALLAAASGESRQKRDYYALVRIHYGAGMVQMEGGQLKAARKFFRRAMTYARVTHDWEGLRDALTALHSLGNPCGLVSLTPEQEHTLRVVCDHCDRMLGRESGYHLEILRGRGFHPPRPSPKLPAYNPLVDLAAMPKVDLNRYLDSPTLENTPRFVSGTN